MEVISSGEGRELTLTLRGELDHHAAKEAMRKLEWELDAALPSKLTLDFSGVSFMEIAPFRASPEVGVPTIRGRVGPESPPESSAGSFVHANAANRHPMSNNLFIIHQILDFSKI